jgi:hypothetical protein
MSPLSEIMKARITAADVTTLARNGDTEVVVLSPSCLDAQ